MYSCTRKKAVTQGGITLVELVMVVGCISILLGLSLPAVQSARESSRRIVCINNLRNLAIATQTFETAKRKYPICSLNAAPDTNDYTRDTTPIRQLLPFFEQNALSDAWDDQSYSFSPTNSQLSARRLAMLNCPSSPSDQVLISGAMKFGGGAVSGLDVAYADYVGNGFVDRPRPEQRNMRGMFAIAIETFSTDIVRHSDVTDGHSNTVLYWESLGGAWFNRRGNLLLQSNFESYPALGLVITSQDRSGVIRAYPFSTVASIKSYLAGWAGFRVGTLVREASRPINWENRAMEPFSMHPGSCAVAFVDGQVQNLSEQISHDVLSGLCSRNGSDNVAID